MNELPATPWQRFAKECDAKETERLGLPEGWDWRAALPSWVWHSVALAGYPDWDRVGDAPPFVMLKHSESDASRKAATKFDDDAIGLFYYRDWTSSGIPFLSSGEMYWSGFWFQKMSDALAFHAEHGGAASWEPDFETKRRAMNARRNAS